jgi:hypothetical protein
LRTEVQRVCSSPIPFSCESGRSPKAALEEASLFNSEQQARRGAWHCVRAKAHYPLERRRTRPGAVATRSHCAHLLGRSLSPSLRGKQDAHTRRGLTWLTLGCRLPSSCPSVMAPAGDPVRASNPSAVVKAKKVRKRLTGATLSRCGQASPASRATQCNVPSVLHRNAPGPRPVVNALVRGHDLGWNDRPHGAGRGPGHVARPGARPRPLG